MIWITKSTPRADIQDVTTWRNQMHLHPSWSEKPNGSSSQSQAPMSQRHRRSESSPTPAHFTCSKKSTPLRERFPNIFTWVNSFKGCDQALESCKFSKARWLPITFPKTTAQGVPFGLFCGWWQFTRVLQNPTNANCITAGIVSTIPKPLNVFDVSGFSPSHVNVAVHLHEFFPLCCQFIGLLIVASENVPNPLRVHHTWCHFISRESFQHVKACIHRVRVSMILHSSNQTTWGGHGW